MHRPLVGLAPVVFHHAIPRLLALNLARFMFVKYLASEFRSVFSCT
jgi:hypothetical protein